MLNCYTKYFLAFSLFLILFSAKVESQSFSENVGPGASFRYGFIAQHRDNISHLIKGHIPSFEFSLSRLTSGSELWHYYYKQPTYGLLYIVHDLSNPQQLGHSHALVPFFAFPLFQKGKFRLLFRLGIGLAYLTKTFDLKTNPKNNAIGTHLNAAYDGFLLFRYRPLQSTSAHIGFGFAHYSNGAWKMPNLGLNIFAINCGFRYLLKPQPFIENKEFHSPTEQEQPYEYIAMVNFGMKESYPINSGSKPVYSLHGEVFRTFNSIGQWGLGLDMLHNTSLSTSYDFDESDYQPGFYDLTQIGIKAAYALRISKLKIVLQGGTYLHDESPENYDLYTVIALRYYITKAFLCNVSIKSHQIRADHIEWGVAYSFEN